MGIEARRAYLKAIRERYQKALKREKSLILNEFCQVCGYSRNYAIQILNGRLKGEKRKRGCQSKYGPEVVEHLLNLWFAMNKMCSKKIVVALPLWLQYYREPSFTKDIEQKLLSMSSSTIDRLLRPYRRKKRKGLSGTKAFIKHKIPLELLDKNIPKPGFVEGDTVLHCGDTLRGSYINSLTVTDLFSGWTENRATWKKTADAVLEKIKDIEKTLPFLMLGFASDNGNEFMNDSLHYYFTYRSRRPIKFVRRRPYRKNDNAHVEQKNHTHVRQLFGYERFDDPGLVGLMNEIYKAYWNPLLNYFTPTLKLKEKIRVGSKIKKKYDTPKTPYERILESPDVYQGLKLRLKEHFKTQNPFYLKKQLDKKLKEFYRIVEINKRKAG